MEQLARPKMNVPKALLRRCHWLQGEVDFILEYRDRPEAAEDKDRLAASLLHCRAEIKWINYMLRETTGRGRVRHG